jgi:hypothetical protein
VVKLKSTINALYQKTLSEKERSSLVQLLQDNGDIRLAGESVTLPGNSVAIQ